jgi:hypothetical protein
MPGNVTIKVDCTDSSWYLPGGLTGGDRYRTIA